MALAKPPLMPHIVRQRTADGPMAELMALTREAEQRSGVVCVSPAAGFAYADVPRMGMGVVAVTDNDPELAAEVAASLGQAAWERRAAFTHTLPAAAAAVRAALAEPEGSGPVVLADVADNVGGGAPGDGTVLLAELLRQGPAGAVVLLAGPGSRGGVPSRWRARDAVRAGGRQGGSDARRAGGGDGTRAGDHTRRFPQPGPNAGRPRG
jgi:microcystin degradation protein MlrC